MASGPISKLNCVRKIFGKISKLHRRRTARNLGEWHRHTDLRVDRHRTSNEGDSFREPSEPYFTVYIKAHSDTYTIEYLQVYKCATSG